MKQRPRIYYTESQKAVMFLAIFSDSSNRSL